jgi:hypothetical protein
VKDSDIDVVYIYRGKSKGFEVNTSSRLNKNDRTDTKYTDYNVAPGEKYYYKVVTMDAAGNKSGAKIISITLPTTGAAAVVKDEGTESLPEGTVLGAETGPVTDNVTPSTPVSDNKVTTDKNGKVLGDQQAVGTSGDSGLALWQWILIVLVIGFAGYFIFFRRSRNSVL